MYGTELRYDEGLVLYNIHYLKQLEDRYYSLLHQSGIKLID